MDTCVATISKYMKHRWNIHSEHHRGRHAFHFFPSMCFMGCWGTGSQGRSISNTRNLFLAGVWLCALMVDHHGPWGHATKGPCGRAAKG